MKRSLILLLAGAITLTSPAGRAAAQDTGGARDALCLHFSGDSPGLLVQLRHGSLLSGTVPLTLCGLESGVTYDLRVRGTGYEVRQGYLSIDGEGNVSIRGNRLGTFARNIVPGWGSVHVGRKHTGLSDLADIVMMGLVTLRENNEYQHIENRYTNLMDMLEAADNAEDRQRIRIDANKASRDLNVQNAHRKRCLGYTAWMYGFQLIDPWLVGNPPKTRVTAGGSVIEVTGAGSSTFKAAFLSLLRPGRGQFYQHKSSRGILYSVATTVGVIVALENLNRYEEAVNAYETNLDYYYMAETPEDREYYSERSSAYWTDVEKTQRWRNISYGVLAGVWAAGVIDTFFPGREDAPPPDLSFDVSPTRASIVYRF
jgi:hypothetical protein